MLTESDYRECRFIDTEMKFYTFDDFVQNAKVIKRLYDCLNHKIFYQWYVYSHCISMKRKNFIWMYLNNDISYEKLTKL